jgi:hypothetical protein
MDSEERNLSRSIDKIGDSYIDLDDSAFYNKPYYSINERSAFHNVAETNTSGYFDESNLLHIALESNGLISESPLQNTMADAHQNDGDNSPMSDVYLSPDINPKVHEKEKYSNGFEDNQHGSIHSITSLDSNLSNESMREKLLKSRHVRYPLTSQSRHAYNG